MIGKKNIVFGFIYLVFTAALGPYMVQQFPEIMSMGVDKQELMANLQLLEASDFEDVDTLELLPAEELARLNTQAILAVNKAQNARLHLEQVKSGPHAHGNLEALLNIVVGIVLSLVVCSSLWKQLVSWLFILGALLHSGMLYLRAFDVAWANNLLGTGLGPVFILTGLLCAGVMVLVSRLESPSLPTQE